MEKVATLPAKDRAELFRETATRRGLSNAISEKDFWVGWSIAKLFDDPSLARKILFKGGTSLSKVFGLIERFSEDIDLILDWKEITNEDPEAMRSRTKQDQFNKQLQLAAQDYIRDQLLPLCVELLAPVVSVELDPKDPNVISVKYPASFAETYIRPEIRLEIGPLAIWTPNEKYEITPYCAEEFPNVFNRKTCHVQCIKAERTFWEKATILHHEAFRPEGSAQPDRYSRHYYDLARLAQSPVKEAAFSDLSLLSSVVASKERFYPRGWARYDLAKPGTMRLLPPEHIRSSLERDYREMQVMIYGEIPDFDDLQSQIKTLESEINALSGP
jgi:hypothetical protein